MSILNEITESQVADWLTAKLVELRATGKRFDCLEVQVDHYSGQPKCTFSISNVAEHRSFVICGHKRDSLAAALDDYAADEKRKLGNPDALRDKAKDLLDQAEKLDGKPVYLTLRPDAPSAAAEATQEGRLLPDRRPNPHDA